MKKTLLLISIISFGLLSSNTALAATAKIGPCAEDVCVDYFKKYKKYARLGYTDAMFTLGEMYYFGHGTDKNVKKALKQYKNAAKYGSVKGQYKAGILFLNEEDVKDIDDGIKYLKKAARNNYVNASLVLGMIYFSKDYFEQDHAEADKWLAKAYEKGHKKAPEFVERMKATEGYDAANFPELMTAIADNPIAIVKAPEKTSATQVAKQPSNKSKMEVITVYGTLPELFDAQLLSLRGAYPEKYAKATGSNIVGNTCQKSIACGMTFDGDYERLANHFMGHHAVVAHKREGIGW